MRNTTKTARLTIKLVYVLIVSLGFSACNPPYKPNRDEGTGMLIYTGTCQNQKVYLMDIVYLHAYQSGYSYADTLTLNGTTYSHVVRLDTTQSNFLSKSKVLDKISIDFEQGVSTALPSCADLHSAKVETVKVLSISSTRY